MGDEPIWAKTTTDYGTVDKPHGYGAPRFDATGKQTPRSPDTGIERDGWRVVGWVTSGGYRALCRESRWRRAMCRRSWRATRARGCLRLRYWA